MGQHHSLGIGAGAAGIEQFSQGVFVEVHHIRPVRRRLRQNVFIISWREPGSLRCSVKHEESLHSRNALPKRIHDLSELFFQEEHFHPGVIQNVGQFPRSEPEVQREQHRAGFQYAVIRFEKPMAIQAEKCNPVARFHPRFAQSTGETAGTFTELCVSETTVSTNHGRLSRELLFGISQESYGGKRNIHGFISPLTRRTDLHPPPARDRSHSSRRQKRETQQLLSSHVRCQNAATECGREKAPHGAAGPGSTCVWETSQEQLHLPEYCDLPICRPSLW